MISNSDVRPPILKNLGDGSWHYNYRIKELTDMEETSGFEYETVKTWGKPDYSTLVPLVIAEYYDPSRETCLINKYNSYNLGFSSDIEEKRIYEDYLQDVSELKSMIKKDLQDYENEKNHVEN